MRETAEHPLRAGGASDQSVAKVVRRVDVFPGGAARGTPTGPCRIRSGGRSGADVDQELGDELLVAGLVEIQFGELDAVLGEPEIQVGPDFGGRGFASL